jgi:hypothetical protein
MVCPSCGCEQGAGLLCARETDLLEKALGDVRWIVTELGVTMSKQARMGTPGKGGLARERSPLHLGALEASDTLGNVLSTWMNDVIGGQIRLPSTEASWVLLANIPDIRKHPAVEELLDEITDAIEQARRAVDRPADRAYLGQCYTELPGEDGELVTCYAEIWSRPDASETTCKVCGVTHAVAERRAWLVEQARPMVVTAREASRYLADVGAIEVNEKTIRSWVTRGKLLMRPGLSDQRQFELGELMRLIANRQVERHERDNAAA